MPMLYFDSWPLSLKYLTRTYGKYGVYAALKNKPKRYQHLLKEINKNKVRVIMEIGVYNGVRAIEMIEAAKLCHPADQIEYYGFDLFRTLSDQEMASEFSKQPQTTERIYEMLRPLGAQINLYEGFTHDTLPPFVEEMKAANKTIDFCFIDGGHAHETIVCDWEHTAMLMHDKSVVVFDDYYLNQAAEELKGIGCQDVIDNLDPTVYQASVYPQVDSFQKPFGQLDIRFARVQKKA